MSKEKIYLNTNLHQIDVVKVLVEEVEPCVEYLTYNIRRYKVPVVLVLFYSEEDISQSIKETMRLTDVITVKKIANSYFNFIYLPFTETVEAYEFIKHVEKKNLNNPDFIYHFEQLAPTVHNYYNFINSYLFNILERKELKLKL
ncbi:MAG: hypothetical protein K8R44_00125 [Sulfurimonas sp.]|nr:hypothetical protein [Sulfurimonas sp.]